MGSKNATVMSTYGLTQVIWAFFCVVFFPCLQTGKGKGREGRRREGKGRRQEGRAQEGRRGEEMRRKRKENKGLLLGCPLNGIVIYLRILSKC